MSVKEKWGGAPGGNFATGGFQSAKVRYSWRLLGKAVRAIA